MKTYLCAYGTPEYSGSLKLLKKTAIEIGKVDEVFIYDKDWLLNSDFYLKNKYILDKPRGGGFWLWKIYIILESLKKMEDGDIIIYTDAGIKVINDLTPLYSLASKGINSGKLFFRIAGGHLNKRWTKRDCFVLMNCDTKEHWDAVQTNAAFQVYVKNEENIKFLNEYLKYARDPRIITDDMNMCGKPNLPEFKDHRHDQSILSLLTVKYNFIMFRDPSQWGNNDKDDYSNYEQLFEHHRQKL
jgi:hypothetical protein